MRISEIVILFTIILALTACSNEKKDKKIVSKISGLENQLKNKDALLKQSEKRIRSLNEKIKNLEDNKENLSKIISKYIKHDKNSAYMIIALAPWKDKSDYVYAYPLAMVKGDKIYRPDHIDYIPWTKQFFSSDSIIYVITREGYPVGYLTPSDEYRYNEVKLKFQSKPDTSVKFQMIQQVSQLYAVASNRISANHKTIKKHQLNEKIRNNGRTIAKKLLSKRYSIEPAINEIETANIQIINPVGYSDSLIVGRYKYEDENKVKYTSFFIKTYNQPEDSLMFKSVSQRTPKQDKGPRYMTFLDIIDYNLDGYDELVLVEYGYEYRYVYFYKIADGKLIELYRVPTQLT